MGNPLINELIVGIGSGPLQHGPAEERQPVRGLLPGSADRAHRGGALWRRAVGAGPASQRPAAARDLRGAHRGARHSRRARSRPAAAQHGRGPTDPRRPAASACWPATRPASPTAAACSTTSRTSRCASAWAACWPRRSPGSTPTSTAGWATASHVNDKPYQLTFPYVAFAPDGRNRRHIDPGERGGGPISFGVFPFGPSPFAGDGRFTRGAFDEQRLPHRSSLSVPGRSHPRPAAHRNRRGGDRRAIPGGRAPGWTTAMALSRRARETSDPAFYARALDTLGRAEALSPATTRWAGRRVWALLGQHRFCRRAERGRRR